MPQLAGPTDPAADARWPDVKPRKSFFTDTSICIGCKACEVACKEWNRNPRDGDLDLLESSYDNTGALGASTWRHVAFIEQGGERISEARATGRALVDLGMPAVRPPAAGGTDEADTHATPAPLRPGRWPIPLRPGRCPAPRQPGRWPISFQPGRWPLARQTCPRTRPSSAG